MIVHGRVVTKRRVLPGYSGPVSELSSEGLAPSRDLVGLFQTMAPYTDSLRHGSLHGQPAPVAASRLTPGQP